jgi:hypothetical protein
LVDLRGLFRVVVIQIESEGGLIGE